MDDKGLAKIMKAMICAHLAGLKSKNKRVFDDCVEWLFSDNEDGKYAIGFPDACYIVGLNREWLRKGIKKYLKRRGKC